MNSAKRWPPQLTSTEVSQQARIESLKIIWQFNSFIYFSKFYFILFLLHILQMRKAKNNVRCCRH